MRLKAGTLSGLSAGDTSSMDESAESVLDHLSEVWPAGDDKVWCSTLADRLADVHPGIYEGWTGEQVTSAVKPHGLGTVQIKRDGSNRKGLVRTELLAAVANRDAADTPVDGDGRGVDR
jgi:S-DNA-T family DNA segregation ATPase FtsK/SpoIIIE